MFEDFDIVAFAMAFDRSGKAAKTRSHDDDLDTGFLCHFERFGDLRDIQFVPLKTSCLEIIWKVPFKSMLSIYGAISSLSHSLVVA